LSDSTVIPSRNSQQQAIAKTLQRLRLLVDNAYFEISGLPAAISEWLAGPVFPCK
jgi:hypothetical protein